MNKQIRYLLLGLTAMVVTGPVSAHQKDKELEARIERLERMADNPVLMQLSRRLGEQQTEIQKLNDRVDRLNYQLKQYKDRLDQRYQETDDRLNQLEKTSQPSPARNPGSSRLPAAPNVPAQAGTLTPSDTSNKSVSNNGALNTRPATAEEKKVYQEAFQKMKNTDFKEAAVAFGDFRTQYPESDLASNAAYWSGEAYMVLGNKEKALTAFQDVYENYPTSGKASSSMLRAADTLLELGQKDRAKSLLETLVKKYPDDRMADKANSRLKTL